MSKLFRQVQPDRSSATTTQYVYWRTRSCKAWRSGCYKFCRICSTHELVFTMCWQLHFCSNCCCFLHLLPQYANGAAAAWNRLLMHSLCYVEYSMLPVMYSCLVYLHSSAKPDLYVYIVPLSELSASLDRKLYACYAGSQRGSGCCTDACSAVV